MNFFFYSLVNNDRNGLFLSPKCKNGEVVRSQLLPTSTSRYHSFYASQHHIGIIPPKLLNIISILFRYSSLWHEDLRVWDLLPSTTLRCSPRQTHSLVLSSLQRQTQDRKQPPQAPGWGLVTLRKVFVAGRSSQPRPRSPGGERRSRSVALD